VGVVGRAGQGARGGQVDWEVHGRRADRVRGVACAGADPVLAKEHPGAAPAARGRRAPRQRCRCIRNMCARVMRRVGRMVEGCGLYCQMVGDCVCVREKERGKKKTKNKKKTKKNNNQRSGLGSIPQPRQPMPIATHPRREVPPSTRQTAPRGPPAQCGSPAAPRPAAPPQLHRVASCPRARPGSAETSPHWARRATHGSSFHCRLRPREPVPALVRLLQSRAKNKYQLRCAPKNKCRQKNKKKTAKTQFSEKQKTQMHISTATYEKKAPRHDKSPKHGGIQTWTIAPPQGPCVMCKGE
jgi:hypothetical protein